MTVFTHPEFDDHENVVFCHCKSSGVKGMIAIHDTTLGPAAGGCRMHAYASEEEALTDVLRLSRGMSYKNAMAGLPLGGGKCVLIADPKRCDKSDILREFSTHIQMLGGHYWAAIDVGVGPVDADILAENCDYVFARASEYPPGFNPSMYTALGGFTAIRATAAHVWGRDNLKGLRVAVQGLGGTGSDVCRQLAEVGAELYVADLKQKAVEEMVTRHGAIAIDPAQIHAQDVDVFVPCAMGAVINDESLPQIKAKAICGLANNQLAEARHGEALLEKGIVYVPDYIANAGGMMGAATTIYSESTHEDSINRVLTLFDTVLSLLKAAEAQGRCTADVADEMARKKLLRNEH